MLHGAAVKDRSAWLCLSSALLLGCAVSAPAVAISTEPTLLLMSAASAEGTSARVVRLEGVLPAEDLVQLAFPIHVLVRETQLGTTYVRYDLSSGAVAGSADALADGLDPEDVAGLVRGGDPASDARVVLLGRDRIELRLPDSFPSGSAEAILFFLYRGTPILSNSIVFEIGEIAP